MVRHARSGVIALAIAVLLGFGGMSPAVAAGDGSATPQGVATESIGPSAMRTEEPTASDPPDDPVASPPPSTPPADSPAPESPPTEEPTTEPTPTGPPPTEPPPATTPPATSPPASESPEETEAPEVSGPTEAPTSPRLPASGSERLSAATQSTVIPFPTGVQRLSGGDRYETAMAVSQRFGPNVPVLYVATGNDFADGLSAASAAAHVGGPLLLTPTAALPTRIRAEIVRLAPKQIIVVGGESIVGPDVFRDLASLTPSIRRIAGIDRYATGELLVADAFSTARQAFVATGRSFPDALAASAAAGAIGAPVLLVDGASTNIKASVVSALRRLGVGTVRIAGGTGAVSASIASQLAANGFPTVRHEGADRYLTAAAINEAVFGVSATSGRDAYIATGADFADALAGAALAGVTGDPMYLTQRTCIPHPVWVALGQLAPPTRVIVGGAAVVGDQVAADTPCPIVWAKPASGRITDVFGPRDPICTPSGCTQSVHRGVDIGTGCNAPIYAASGGRVSIAGWVGTYGNFVKIAHGSVTDTGYAHLVNGGVLVKVGQLVRAGQQIGWSGMTGAATGCHLHFEVYQKGVQIDPVPFMRQRGIVLG